MSWTTVCSLDDILPNAGVAALVNDTQIALFRVDDKVYALANKDPFSNANVLSRGIVGNLQDTLVVASPIYKQHFSLEAGTCLEDDTVSVPCYAARTEGGLVQVQI
ncbi:nitrite reductase small subunit NirD [Spongiibacter sp. KMU-166]|uniref:Nitrite reductase small subunit NirD n=1 Tax=Spongiibacter thalassae TaxID=2721624 RepID=A0ABX1GIE5_9GAMM|nr:nitrite reductase small subunit NirD [Spongiibacter thalassae]NKI18994.1 nitrite reductase small subunit NirD [Spongiibacter thalassae]